MSTVERASEVVAKATRRPPRPILTTSSASQSTVAPGSVTSVTGPAVRDSVGDAGDAGDAFAQHEATPEEQAMMNRLLERHRDIAGE